MQDFFKKYVKALSLIAAVSTVTVFGGCAMSTKTPTASAPVMLPETTIAVVSPLEEGVTILAPEIIEHDYFEEEITLPPESIGDPAADLAGGSFGIKSPESTTQKYGEYKTLKEEEKKAQEEADKKAEEEKNNQNKDQNNSSSTIVGGKVTVNKNEISSIINNTSFSSSKVVVSGKDLGTNVSALTKAIKSKNYKCSVLAVRLRDGAIVGYNCDMQIKCKSTIKAVSALYAYKQYEAGKISLNATKAYAKKFYYGGSGKIRKSAVGTKYTLKTLIDYSIIYSDNSAYLMVNDFFDAASIKGMMKDMGCSCYGDSSDEWPMINARDAALWWNEIYNYCKDTKSASGLWKAFLNSCGTQVKQALGMEYDVAHKTGSGNGYYHDAGVVLSDDPYVYVILTYKSSASDSAQKSYMMNIASALHNIMNP